MSKSLQKDHNDQLIGSSSKKNQQRYRYLPNTKRRQQLLNNYQSEQYQLKKTHQYKEGYQSHINNRNTKSHEKPNLIRCRANCTGNEAKLKFQSQNHQFNSTNNQKKGGSTQIFDSQLSFCRQKEKQNSPEINRKTVKLNEFLKKQGEHQHSINELNQNYNFTKNLNFLEFSPYGQSRHQDKSKLLVEELQEQYRIVKKQTCQLQYQNQLLKQKLISYEKESHFYQEKLSNKDVQIEQLNLIIDQNMAQKQSYKILIQEMKEEINILLKKTTMLQVEIKDKDYEIVKLRTKDQMNLINQKGRRNSLDGCRMARDGLRDRRILDEEQRRQESLKKRKGSIGKLMNKTLDTYNRGFRDNQNLVFQQSENSKIRHTCICQKENSIERQSMINKKEGSNKISNLIESISNMFEKIHGRKATDLKETWKWLKRIVHQSQTLKGQKNNIKIILQEIEGQDKDLSFMDQECYRVLNKIQSIISE